MFPLLTLSCRDSCLLSWCYTDWVDLEQVKNIPGSTYTRGFSSDVLNTFSIYQRGPIRVETREERWWQCQYVSICLCDGGERLPHWINWWFYQLINFISSERLSTGLEYWWQVTQEIRENLLRVQDGSEIKPEITWKIKMLEEMLEELLLNGKQVEIK